MYDFAIVGAGVNGCAIAHELVKEGSSVLLLDKEAIASGGSGAAGAFVAPKFAKSGELKELMHNSFIYSMAFYEKNFPSAFSKVELLHMATDEKTSQMLRAYKESTTLPQLPMNDDVKRLAGDDEAIFIEAGVVDAAKMCHLLCEGAEFAKVDVERLERVGQKWVVNETIEAKNVILATGAYKKVIDESYLKIRGIWGHRIEVKTSTQNRYSLHKYLSISPSKDGIIAIGATHNLSYHPQTSSEPYDLQQGRVELLDKAKKMLDFEELEVVKDFVGLRSGSVDYMPLIGSVVDAKKSYAQGKNFRKKGVSYKEFIYYENLYMINGSSGYGFVFAPYLAKMLKAHILEGAALEKSVDVARYFAREARRS